MVDFMSCLALDTVNSWVFCVLILSPLFSADLHIVLKAVSDLIGLIVCIFLFPVLSTVCGVLVGD